METTHNWAQPAFICNLIDHMEERLPRMEAVRHLVSEEHADDSVLEHCSSEQFDKQVLQKINQRDHKSNKTKDVMLDFFQQLILLNMLNL